MRKNDNKKAKVIAGLVGIGMAVHITIFCGMMKTFLKKVIDKKNLWCYSTTQESKGALE